MAEWVAYGDDWTFSSDDGGPADVPAFGLLAIAQVSEATGYELLRGRTYFVWTDGMGWDCHDAIGLHDRLAHFPGCIVRFGRSVPSDRFRAVIQRAAEDDRLPRKSASERREDPGSELVD